MDYLPAFGNLKDTACHEASHVQIVAAGEPGRSLHHNRWRRTDKALDEPDENETPHQRILYAMSSMFLSGDYDLLSDLRQHTTKPDYFNKAHRQAIKLLLEKYAIAFDTIHSLFIQGDVEYGLASRSKSDIVCRKISKAFRWPMPCGLFFIGWNFKPIPASYVALVRIGLDKLAERIKRQVFG